MKAKTLCRYILLIVVKPLRGRIFFCYFAGYLVYYTCFANGKET